MNRKMNEQDVRKLLSLIKTAFPSFEISENVITLWTSFIKDEDYETVTENFREYTLTNKFAPTIHDMVKKNDNVQAKREKERTRKMIEDKERLLLETSTQTPWEKEGVTHREYLHRILGENRGKKDA